ncbi:MAG: hypothetical protein IMY70_03645 [Bacteroidetes bacterium]|nr:hypothetical protein [Bacteroidota bacterium]
MQTIFYVASCAVGIPYGASYRLRVTSYSLLERKDGELAEYLQRSYHALRIYFIFVVYSIT